MKNKAGQPIKFARKDSVPPTTPCATCGHPASPHNYRHPFTVIDTSTPIATTRAATGTLPRR